MKTAPKKCIYLKINEATHFVDFDNIIRLEAQVNYTLFYLAGRAILVITAKTLKYYMEKLNEKQFISPHQSHLIKLSLAGGAMKKREDNFTHVTLEIRAAKQLDYPASL